MLPALINVDRLELALRHAGVCDLFDGAQVAFFSEIGPFPCNIISKSESTDTSSHIFKVILGIFFTETMD